MIRKPTVLVLGAGASMPYGFPSGEGLIQNMKPNWDSWGTQSAQVLTQAGITKYKYEAFVADLWGSSTRSIDAFLEHRLDHMSIGKAIIAFLLIQCENPSTLMNPNGGTHWMRYLFSLMDEDAAAHTFHENKLGIITYNYDRSFEYALLTHLRSLFRMTPDQYRRVFDAIPILHLHGTLAPLADLHENGRPYRQDVTADDVTTAVQHIRVIHESDVGTDHNFQRAKLLLSQAEQVFFLGFGYHKLNVKRLCIDEHCPQSELYGTCYGMSVGEVSRTSSLLKRGIHLNNEDVLTCLRRLAHRFS